MNRKLHLALATFFLVSQAFANPLEIKADGDRGRDGSVEQDFSNRASDGSYSGDDGSDGQDGRNATKPTAGEKGGQIVVSITRGQKPNSLIVKGTAKKFNQSNETKVDKIVDIPAAGSAVNLSARGGGGGNGGIGGGGQDGGYGKKGSDATQWSTGGNGGDGGDGGRPGEGTDGARSGDGGINQIQVESHETDLLMLVEVDVGVDDPGKVGRHGRVGRGGQGGSGGDSYSWTEYHTETEYYTDSDGKSQSRTVTVSKSYTNAGGSSGSSGSDGRSSNMALSAGEKGQLGIVEIFVKDSKSGLKKYSSRYNLELEEFKIVSQNEDGIIEPGEMVYLKHIKVRNNGGMPLPGHTKVLVYFEDSTYFKTVKRRLDLPLILNAGESFTFAEDSLSLKIRNDILQNSGEESPTAKDDVHIRAGVESVNREFKGASRPTGIKIEYPIKIEPIFTARSMAPGEKSKIVIKVSNVSTNDISTRDIEFAIARSGGNLAASSFQVRDAGGEALDLNLGFLKSIGTIQAGKSYVFEGEVSINANAEAFQDAHVTFRSSLSDIETNKLEETQRRKISFKVSQIYQHNPNADILLVVNNAVTADLVNAWKSMLSKIGLAANIWDLSYYSHLNFATPLAGGTSLGSDFKGKTVVVLNNDYVTNMGQQQPVYDLPRTQLPNLLQTQGAGLLVFGGDTNKFQADGLTFVGQEASDVPTVNLKKWTFGKRPPKIAAMQTKAQEMESALRMANPQNNYYMTWNFSPESIKRSPLGIGQTWNLGSFEIGQSLGLSDGPLVLLNADSNSVLSAENVDRAEVKLALYSSMPMSLKMKILNGLARTIQKNKNSVAQLQELNLVIDSIIRAVAFENDRVHRLTKLGVTSNSHFEKQFVLLRQISELAQPLLNLDPARNTDPVARTIMRMIVEIEQIVNFKQTWWQRLMWLNADARASKAAKSIALAAMNKFFPNNVLFDSNKDGQFSRWQISAMRYSSERNPKVRSLPTAHQVVNPNLVGTSVPTSDPKFQGASANIKSEDAVVQKRLGILQKQEALLKGTQSSSQVISCIMLFAN